MKVVSVAKRLVATVRARARADNLVQVAFRSADQAWDFLKRHPEIPQPGINIWMYGCNDLAESGSEEGFLVEAGAEVLQAFEPEGAIVCSHTPAGRVATTEHVGPYSGIINAHAAILKWSEENGHELAGPNWEVYGHWDADESKLSTEIFYLLK